VTTDPLALPIGITGITVGYMFGTTRLAALLISPSRFRMPRFVNWVLVDNPRSSQPYGRLWAFIGDVLISIITLVPQGLGLVGYPGPPYPWWFVAWCAVTVGWTVAITWLAVRTRRRA
jgi:hypothetical protein